MTKMVQLSDEAYRRLRAQKREGESFSDVVNRLVGPRRSLRELHGMLSAQEIEAVEEAISEGDRLDREDAAQWAEGGS